MELATDIMAIIGLALFGLLFPEFSPRHQSLGNNIIGFIAFGMIAASLVLE